MGRDAAGRSHDGCPLRTHEVVFLGCSKGFSKKHESNKETLSLSLSFSREASLSAQASESIHIIMSSRRIPDVCTDAERSWDTQPLGHVIVPYGEQHTVAEDADYLRECIRSFGDAHLPFANAAKENDIKMSCLWEANSRQDMYELCESLFECFEADVTKEKVDAIVRVLENVRDMHPGCRNIWQTGYIAPAREPE